MEEPITLIIKAPNQQIEDQTIHCEINWTVKRLKDHLSEVYPSTPRPQDQKLIYSGQLLNDNVILKDILRVYEGQENHTVHLVCSPLKDSYKVSSIPKKPTPMIPSATQPAQDLTDNGNQPDSNREGVRQRFAPAFIPQSPQSWPFPLAQAVSGTPTPTPIWPALGTYDAANMAQQMMYMQQAYTQYMTQYMQLMASGNTPAGMQIPPTVNTPPPAAPPQPLRDDPLPANDVVQNVGEDEDLQANRDWLDWFYIMSRMLVLFSIVYFYSSPVRFFLVTTLGIIMYLYQVGFFRAVNRLEQQEEAPVIPPPTPDNNNTPPPPETPQAPPSALAITWAAFSSFFLSLLPEQPNVL